MKTKQLIQSAALTGLLVLSAPQTFAGLHIRPVFIGGTPPAGSLIAGGGDLQEIFKVAAEAWENMFDEGGGKWTITVEFGWDPIGNQFAKEILLEQGGNPVRITRSRVLFNNNPPLHQGLLGWFADSTPRDNSEYLRYTSDRANVVGGQLNVGRVFSEATGDATDRLDLLTLAMHEIGHALGLDYQYSGFAAQFKQGLFLEITAPRPHAGLELIMNFGPHIDGFGTLPLMVPDPTPGWRQLISGVDALAIAQASSFDGPEFRHSTP